MNTPHINILDTLLPKGNILTEEQTEKIKSNGRFITFKKKEVIFREGTPTSHVIFLETGLIKLYREGRNNRSLILKIAKPGEFIGLVSVFGNNIYQYSASAIENSSVFFIDFNVFNSILLENGKYAIHLLKNVSQDNLNIFDRIISQYQKQLPGKIADIILYFSNHIYNSEEFEFPITRNELAELAGTTKESFIRTLTEFKNDKIIEIDGKQIRIKSIDIVKTLSRLG
ncbi:MAG: Crp/Fnr family transcriptional regulator [Bacteroidetes bacterium]|nr:Crp/Fnr family transcriptional regulator [Bacteroidota bacterium]